MVADRRFGVDDTAGARAWYQGVSFACALNVNRA